MKYTLTLLAALLLALPVARASDIPKPTHAANCEFPANWVLYGMADRLTLSVHTVDTYLRRIYEKLAVNTRTGAVAKALKEGLV